jgi:xanthine dehydrogenase accessory factor
MAVLVLIRGGGDLASGVALRLYRAGLRLLITELPQPLVVRRTVSFAEAIYEGSCQVEGITAIRASSLDQALRISTEGSIPVLVDPDAQVQIKLNNLRDPLVLVDARMTKLSCELTLSSAALVVGLGPGCVAGENCHAVVETHRGHQLGRVIWNGVTETDTGVPEAMPGEGRSRVLRAPVRGLIQAFAQIGDHVENGQVIARVDDAPVISPFTGMLRGMIHSGLIVWQGLKIGDVDPRDDPSYCFLVSDKALAVGGGVLEAILSTATLRPYLWD